MDSRNEWRNQLISRHAAVARRIALKMARRCPGWVAREDLTYPQIAETLRITPSRVCQLLWRAVDRLRALLGEQTMVDVRRSAAC